MAKRKTKRNFGSSPAEHLERGSRDLQAAATFAAQSAGHASNGNCIQALGALGTAHYFQGRVGANAAGANKEIELPNGERLEDRIKTAEAIFHDRCVKK